MSSLIISCVDGRIRDRLKELENAVGEENCLWMLVPGGPLVFSGSGNEIDSVLGWAEMFVTRQGVRRIILASHQHCLAYERKLGGFFHDEREVLSRDLGKAKKALTEKFFSIRVDVYLIPWFDEKQGSGFGAAERVADL